VITSTAMEEQKKMTTENKMLTKIPAKRIETGEFGNYVARDFTEFFYRK
jgi:hypothetical protein